MQLTIGGKRWNFVRKYRRNECGSCDPPDKPNKMIRVQPSLRGEHELETILHEMLHASAWDVLSHDYITPTAKEFARALYRLGYRKQG